jgi:acetyl esterase/lipase
MIASLLDTMRPHIYKPDGYEKWINDLIDLKAKACLTPVEGIFTTDVVIKKEHDVWARIFQFSETKDNVTGQEKKFPVVVYFHGGGFTIYDPESSDYDKLCRKVAKATGAIVISVNYRRTPYHKYPIPYDDCYTALEWLKVCAKLVVMQICCC